MPAPPVQLTVPTTDRPSFDLAAPGSKSLTNRALLLAALAAGTSRLNGALDAEDTRVMRQALTDLGFSVEGDVNAPVVHGLGGRVPASSARLDLRLSGTSIRFLAALCALGTGRFELDGNARMRERPIGDLIAALRQLGARVTALASNDCPPLAIEADGLTGGRVTVAGDRSSQFLSALLMVAPYAQGETTVKVTGELQSKPFIDMTVGLMERFGVQVGRESYATFTVAPGVYAPQELTVEGDAMSAGYFWAAAAVTGGRVRVTNLGSSSLQGDRRIIEVLAETGRR